MGIQFAVKLKLPFKKFAEVSNFWSQLRRAKATIPEDDPALYGVWAMDEPRAFLESLGIYQIADHEENVLLSPSDVYSEELASKAIVCLENLTSKNLERQPYPKCEN